MFLGRGRKKTSNVITLWHPRYKKKTYVPQTAKLVLKLNRLFLSRRLLEISLQASALRHANKATSSLSTGFTTYTPWQRNLSNYKLTFSTGKPERTISLTICYMASSVGRQDEPTPALLLATRVGGTVLSCQLGITRCLSEENNVLYTI